MKVNYIDAGLLDGCELRWMVETCLPELGVFDYEAVGFEANPEFAAAVSDELEKFRRVSVVIGAIALSEGSMRLWKATRDGGNSLFRSKRNIRGKDWISTTGIILSKWINKNIPDFKSGFNIIRANIEGAEWYLVKDMIESGLAKHVDVWAGTGEEDMRKVKELKPLIKKYRRLCSDNGIVNHWFTCVSPESLSSMKALLLEKFREAGV